MRTWRIKAWSRQELPLSAEQAACLAASDLVSVQPRPTPGLWEVRAESRVGVLCGPGLELRVEPHLPIPRLMFLLGFAADPRGWRNFTAGFAESERLWIAIANGFAASALRAIEPAPLRGYVAQEERGTTLRGRLRADRQMSRSFGLSLPLHIAFDDFQLDIPENRLLFTTARLLLRFAGLPATLRRRLHRICLELGEVSELPLPWRDSTPPITRLNRHYAPALRLAELILADASLDTEPGQNRSLGFSFDMNRAFEDFVSAAMVAAARRLGRSVKLQHSRDFLDEGRRLRLIPDITWWRGSRCTGVADAKYKQLTSPGIPNPDAYQMLAYCLAFGLPAGYLIYARDALESPVRDHRIAAADVIVHVRSLDLTAEPEQLLAQVESLACALAAEPAAVTSPAG